MFFLISHRHWYNNNNNVLQSNMNVKPMFVELLAKQDMSYKIACALHSDYYRDLGVLHKTQYQVKSTRGGRVLVRAVV